MFFLLPLTVQASGSEVLIGFNQSWLQSQDDLSQQSPGFSSTSSGTLLGWQHTQSISNLGSYRFRLDWQSVQNKALITIKPIGYVHSITSDTRLSSFLGAAVMNDGIPALGWVLGGAIETQFSQTLAGAVEFHYSDKLARDLLLSTDNSSRPDLFHDIIGINMLLHIKF